MIPRKLGMKAPMAGPQTKPKPMAAPTIPIPLARLLASVTSAAAADAIEMFPAIIPARTREKTSRRKPPENIHKT